MRRKTKKTLKKFARLVIVFAILGLIAFIFYYLGAAQHKVVPQAKIGQLNNTLRIKLYYYNKFRDKEGIQDPQAIVPLELEIPRSQTPVKDTVELLLSRQLSWKEKAAGFSTEFPNPKFKLLGLNLKSGVLILKFTEVPGFTSGGAARVNILASQIRKTALQFSQVKKVQFEPEYLFQP